MRRLFQSIKPRTGGWEAFWLLAVQGMIVADLVLNSLGPPDAYTNLIRLKLMAHGYLEDVIWNTYLMYIDYVLGTSSDHPYAWQQFSHQQWTGQVLIVTLETLTGIILLLAGTLWLWLWVPAKHRAFGWDGLALAALYVALNILYDVHGESNYVSERFQHIGYWDYFQLWFFNPNLPLFRWFLISLLLITLGAIYGHLGRILFAKVKRPPEGQAV